MYGYWSFCVPSLLKPHSHHKQFLFMFTTPTCCCWVELSASRATYRDWDGWEIFVWTAALSFDTVMCPDLWNQTFDCACDLVFSSITCACSALTVISVKRWLHLSIRSVYRTGRCFSLKRSLREGGVLLTWTGVYPSQWPEMIDKIAGLPVSDKAL